MDAGSACYRGFANFRLAHYRGYAHSVLISRLPWVSARFFLVSTNVRQPSQLPRCQYGDQSSWPGVAPLFGRPHLRSRSAPQSSDSAHLLALSLSRHHRQNHAEDPAAKEGQSQSHHDLC